MGRATAGLVCAAAALFVARPASAQLKVGVPVQQFQPTPGMAQNFVQVYGTEVVGSLRPALGVFVNYAYRPLVLSVGDERIDVVRHQWTTDLLAAFAIGPTFQVGAALPVTFYQQGEKSNRLPDLDLAPRALGDVRLVPKWRILGPRQGEPGWSLAAVGVLTFPSGSTKDLQGNASVTFEPRAVVEWRTVDRVRTGLNLGYVVRSQQQMLNVDVGNEVSLGAGVSYEVVPDTFTVLGEAYGHVPADPQSAFNIENLPVELNAAGRLRFAQWHTLTVGVGPGLTRGYGSPTVRVYAGYAFDKKELPDRDGDGILDSDDECPDDPEDKDGFEDLDGCPDPDNDQDGILDIHDGCPMDPEDFDEFEDEDGCPEEGPVEVVPPSDRDGDGCPDAEDPCPDSPEDLDGFEDDDCCEDPDNDRDGYADSIDKCPMDPEVWNGVEDEDGCPDEGEAKILLTSTKIEILERVHFEFDKSVIKERSYSILRLVAAVLRANQRVTRLRVEGHTDSKGSDGYNQELSQARAASVANFLIDEGIPANLMEPVGYGESIPIATNMTDEGRALNRRVEFTILEVDGRPVGEVTDVPVREAAPVDPNGPLPVDATLE